MPKISVVLPTYNGQDYLKEAVESIRKQTLRDWELIIVDDCSNDETARISDEYIALDQRIKVIHNKSNKKLPASLNIGFREANGVYLTWTSDDNLYLKNAFEEMSLFLDNNPDYSMVCTDMLMMDSKMHFLREHIGYDDNKMHSGDVVGASFMYRRSIQEQIGEYAEDMFCAEDFDYWVRILESGNKIGRIKGCHYLYRLHEKSLTAQKQELIKSQTRKVGVKHFEWVMSGLKNNTSKILHFYNDIIQDRDIAFEEFKRKILPYVRELEYDVEIPNGKKIFLYGAGEIGRKSIEKYSENVIAYIDGQKILQGKIIKGIPVISPDEVFNGMYNDDSHIIITVGYDKQLDVMKTLINYGVTKYSLMGHIR